MTLKDLPRGAPARVTAISTADADLEYKLREIGFSEGDEVELLEVGPFGRTPLSVRVSRTIVALRATEAAAVEVETEPEA